MKKKINFLITVLSFLLITSCGFKIIDQSKLKNFKIQDIIVAGEKRINYKLKNKLLSQSNSTNNRSIIVELVTSRVKRVNEKNIKNEITKYQLEVTVNIKFYETNNKVPNNFTVVESGNYLVSKKYSQTLNNENKLIEILTERIANNITNNLVQKFNDL
jgi:outer membrane lipopolysaccharide assembly protein LptE/RlpB